MEREQREFDQLRKECKQAGWIWFGTRIDPGDRKFRDSSDDLSIEEKRRKWTQALTSLKDRPFEQRIELLSAISSLIYMEKDHLRSVVRTSLLDREHPLSYLGAQSRVSFTSQSIIFIEEISDMSGYSGKQKKEFLDFIINNAGSEGKVEMPQLFPVISRWIGLGSDASNVQE